MTGETPQPGGREPAPGSLALVQAFLNTHYDLEFERGADLLRTPDSLQQWLLRRRLIDPAAPVGTGDLNRALRIRTGLRRLVESDPLAPVSHLPGARHALNEAAEGASVEVRFTPSGAQFVPIPAGGVQSGLGVVLASAARAMVDGSWRRLKVCPGEDCGWVFFDHSRNQSGRWCSMSVCGGREKARSHYRRKRAGA